MSDGVVLTPAAFLKLKRELDQLRLSHKNLERRVRSYEKHGIARGMAIRIYLGKTDAAITKGNSGVVSIWHGYSMGTEVDTGKNITAKNKFGNIAITKWVIVVVFRGNAYIIAAECP